MIIANLLLQFFLKLDTGDAKDLGFHLVAYSANYLQNTVLKF